MMAIYNTVMTIMRIKCDNINCEKDNNGDVGDECSETKTSKIMITMIKAVINYNDHHNDKNRINKKEKTAENVSKIYVELTKKQEESRPLNAVLSLVTRMNSELGVVPWEQINVDNAVWDHLEGTPVDEVVAVLNLVQVDRA